MVRQLARIVDTHGLTELVVESEDANVTIFFFNVKASTVIYTAPQAMLAAPAVSAAPASAPASEASPSEEAKAEDDNLHVVTSPFVGTFYRAPNPDSPPYVQIGDRVDRGAVLCIVEAMKLMNEIEADMAGEIVTVLVEDGEPVEYGAPLFKIKAV
ncbi:MAG: acetyl-CoA carboxylase biotin carboxyl carrier protein [Deltaproteobacteria bacterium]|nr:acetyl-CoA carboxylase biotin carboxyl carrier protein [Deltaproteobacteria bacterium]